MAGSGSFLDLLLPFVFFFAIFYFLVIRPQQKQQKNHKEMIDSLKKGDIITTTGGLIVKVVKPEKDFIKVEINQDTIAKIDPTSVASKKED